MYVCMYVCMYECTYLPSIKNVIIYIKKFVKSCIDKNTNVCDVKHITTHYYFILVQTYKVFCKIHLKHCNIWIFFSCKLFHCFVCFKLFIFKKPKKNKLTQNKINPTFFNKSWKLPDSNLFSLFYQLNHLTASFKFSMGPTSINLWWNFSLLLDNIQVLFFFHRHTLTSWSLCKRKILGIFEWSV